MAHTQQEFEQLEMELFITRQYLLKAITQLPRKELKITLKDETELGQQPFKLQARFDEAKGVTHFRAVQTFG